VRRGRRQCGAGRPLRPCPRAGGRQPAAPDPLSDMAGHLEKRSLSLAGHRTSVALEPAFWRALEEEAAREGISLAALIRTIDAERLDPSVPLARALRLHVLAARGG